MMSHQDPPSAEKQFCTRDASGSCILILGRKGERNSSSLKQAGGRQSAPQFLTTLSLTFLARVSVEVLRASSLSTTKLHATLQVSPLNAVSVLPTSMITPPAFTSAKNGRRQRTKLLAAGDRCGEEQNGRAAHSLVRCRNSTRTPGRKAASFYPSAGYKQQQNAEQVVSSRQTYDSES